MDTLKIDGALVEVEWLEKHLYHEDLIILDATLPKAVTGNSDKPLLNKRIPGARFFDIKNIFSDTSATYPNTWPGEDKFNQEAQNLGVSNQSSIIVYDDHGIYSCARAWWMFKAMGHHNIAVLNGGLPSWADASFALEEKKPISVEKGDFSGIYNPDFFRHYKDVLDHLNETDQIVIDARAENRFNGLVEEPRKGLRSGHIPGSKNLPYTDLLVEGKMKDLSELNTIFTSIIPADNHLTFTCGSGITACVLALGAELAGLRDISVYDGSWTEWGSIPKLPIEKEE